jgi:hypothetical protein
MHRMTYLLPFALLSLLFAGAAAQVDERARELLEGAHQDAEAVEYRTLEQTMTMIWYEPDGTVASEMTVHTAIDVADRRVAVSSFEGGELTFRMVYSDGEGMMFTPETGFATAPPELAESFLLMLDLPAVQSWDDYEAASYDGHQTYAGIVTGEQVTLRGIKSPIPVPGLDAALDIRLLFDDGGRLIASISEAAELGTMLMVFDEPHPARPLSLQSVTTYLLDRDAVVLVSRTIFEDVRFDEPLDERLFDVDGGGR